MNTKKNTSATVKTALLCVAALACVLALLILVPSSPALLVDEPTILLSMNTGHVNQWDEPVLLLVTGYSVCIAAGAALAMLCTALLGRLRKFNFTASLGLALMSGAFAFVCSRVLYCALRWSYIINDLCGNWTFPVELWQGGYTMYGAIFGGILGAFVWSRICRKRFFAAMDILVPGMLLLIAAGRFGEMFTSQGMANYRAAEALNMLPFSFIGEWGDPNLALYAYEALIAAVALAVSGVMLLRRAPMGRVAETGLAIVSAYQVMMESLRGDELIKFGFVRLNMIAATALLVAIIVPRIVRCVKQRGWTTWQILRIVLLLLGAGVVICVEFALDGKIKLPGVNNTMLFAADALAVTGMMLSVLIADGRKKEVV
nr:prolipoprotein diacylglyceryl transferase [Clostridia bacterium]